MSDFLQVLLDRKQVISEEYSSIHRALTQPDFHVESLKRVLSEAASQFASLPDDPNVLRSEALSILEQVPQVFSENWQQLVVARESLSTRLRETEEMISSYKGWCEEEEKRKALEKEAEKKKKELKKSIKNKKTKEPSRKTGRKRKTGTRPPTTLKKFRQAESDLSSSEDSEG